MPSEPCRVVLVTRPADEAEALSAALAQAGFEVRQVPLSRRLPRPDARAACVAACPAPDVLMLTSAAAIAALGPPGADLQPARIAAVGSATARRATAAGWSVDVVGGGTGADLAGSLGDLAGLQVLWPCAADPAPSTRAALSASHLHEVPVYDTVPDTRALDGLSRALPVHAVLVASPAAARHLRQACTSLGAALPAVISIGPTTTAAAAALGLQVLATATRPDISGLVDATRLALRDQA